MLVVIHLQIILTHANNGLHFLNKSICSGFGKTIFSRKFISFNCHLTHCFNKLASTGFNFHNFKLLSFHFHDVSHFQLKRFDFVYSVLFAFISMTLHNCIGLYTHDLIVIFLNSWLFSVYSWLNQFSESSCAYVYLI